MSDLIAPVKMMRWDTGTLTWVVWDGSLTTGALVIGAVTQSGTWTVQPGNTPNTTAWKVDGSAVTQPVSLADGIDVNAGATTSAAVLTDANGTLSAKLRGIVTHLNRVINLRAAVATSEYGVQISGAAAPAGEVRLAAVTNVDPDTTAAGLVVRNLSGMTALGGGQPSLWHAFSVFNVTAGNMGRLEALTANPAGTEIGLVVRNIPSGTQPVSGTFWQTTATPAQSSVSVLITNTVILAANANRLGATLYNESGAICFVKLGTTATLTSYSVQMAIGGYYEVPFGYTGGIDGITTAITAILRITELTV